MSSPNPLLAGLRGRCPNCGEGRLFEGFLKVAPRCGSCGYDLAKADSGDGPAVFVILIAGFFCAFLMLFTELKFSPPVWVHIVIFLPLTLGVCLGQQYRTCLAARQEFAVLRIGQETQVTGLGLLQRSQPADTKLGITLQGSAELLGQLAKTERQGRHA